MASLLSSVAHLVVLRNGSSSTTGPRSYTSTCTSSCSSSSSSLSVVIVGYQSASALPSTGLGLGCATVSRRRRQLQVISSSELQWKRKTSGRRLALEEESGEEWESGSLGVGSRRRRGGETRRSSRRRQQKECCCSSCERGAGAGAAAARSSSTSSLQWQESLVTMEERRKILQQKGCIVWITGLSGSGKSTVAFAMDRILNSMSKVSYVLDGDKIREGLCKDLGFSAEDRRENIRRVGQAAALFADAGLIAVVSFISPYKRDRDIVRELVPTGNFIEVFMDVPLEVCEERDAKGLYRLARQGVIKAFTGIDDPYEKPLNPEIVIKAVNEHGNCISPDEMARIVIHYLSDKGLLSE